MNLNSHHARRYSRGQLRKKKETVEREIKKKKRRHEEVTNYSSHKGHAKCENSEPAWRRPLGRSVVRGGFFIGFIDE